jgi:hypothetical protein
MLGSDYRELIVPKTDNTAKKFGILIGGCALTLLLLIATFVSGAFWLLLPAAAAGFGTWFLFTQNRIEYEYIISGDELAVTKILAESKRKPMITVSVRQFTAFGNLRDAGQPSDSQTLVLACAAQDAAAFYADFDHSEFGQTRLIWTPNDDILQYLTKFLPRTLNFRYEKQKTDLNDNN